MRQRLEPCTNLTLKTLIHLYIIQITKHDRLTKEKESMIIKDVTIKGVM